MCEKNNGGISAILENTFFYLIIPNSGGVAGILLKATPKLNPKKGCV